MILSTGETVADYKIEIYFPRARSVMQDTHAMLSTWISGGQLNGDLDQGMFWCMDAEHVLGPGTFRKLLNLLKVGQIPSTGCGKLIPPNYVGSKKAVCPSCKRIWEPKHLCTLIPFFGSMTDLVDLVAYFYNALNQNADFYLKHHQGENIKMLVEEAQDKKGWKARERLDTSPGNIVSAIYPLKNIQKDLSAGATIESRIKAFLTS